ERRARLEGLRWVMVTGEACSVELCRRWLSQYPEIPLMNAYGPTECSDDVTHCVIDRQSAYEMKSVPIGRPLANTEAYVLDSRVEPVPVGVTGELYIGGDGVGRGYMNGSATTAERFVVDPFSNRTGARLYRTGDLARWNKNGELEFLGRKDQQVKIRGYRVE